MKKVIIKYLMMYIPFIVGAVLIYSGWVNLLSSLLLFGGGYIAIKNTLDYRLLRKNINKGKMIDSVSVKNVVLNDEKTLENEKNKSIGIKPINHNAEEIIGVKRTRRYTRVRRRY